MFINNNIPNMILICCFESRNITSNNPDDNANVIISSLIYDSSFIYCTHPILTLICYNIYCTFYHHKVPSLKSDRKYFLSFNTVFTIIAHITIEDAAIFMYSTLFYYHLVIYFSKQLTHSNRFNRVVESGSYSFLQVSHFIV